MWSENDLLRLVLGSLRISMDEETVRFCGCSSLVRTHAEYELCAVGKSTKVIDPYLSCGNDSGNVGW